MFYFCCGMRRSGSTLQFNLVKELLSKKYGSVRSSFAEDEDQVNTLFEDHQIESPYLIKCHKYIGQVPSLIKDQKAIVFYIYRDIRDVVVSFINMYDSKTSNVFRSKFIEKTLEEFYWLARKKLMVKYKIKRIPHRRGRARTVLSDIVIALYFGCKKRGGAWRLPQRTILSFPSWKYLIHNNSMPSTFYIKDHVFVLFEKQ